MHPTRLPRIPTAADPRPFRHLLVCLDRSSEAEACLPLVRFIADRSGARVTLMHVLDSEYDRHEQRVTEAVLWELERTDAESYLASLAKRMGPATGTCIRQGSPAQQVAKAAAELGADLTVITTHGSGGAVDAWELGSAAQKILAVARGSILVVPSVTRAPAPRVPPRRVLVPLDGSPRTESVLPTVATLAGPNDAEVVLAHVVHEPLRTSVLSAAEDLALARLLSARLHRRARVYLEGLERRLAESGVRSRLRVEQSSDTRGRLASLVDVEAADLVVICAHGSICDARNAYGSVASYLTTHSHAPLLILQDLSPRVLRKARRRPASTTLARPIGGEPATA